MGAGPRILLVDDEPLFREMVEAKLEPHIPGAQFVHAHSGNEAAKLIENDPSFRVIVSDYQMADGTGFDLVAKLIAQKRKIPVIIFTSMMNLKLPFTDDHPVVAIIEKVNLEKVKEVVLTLGPIPHR